MAIGGLRLRAGRRVLAIITYLACIAVVAAACAPAVVPSGGTAPQSVALGPQAGSEKFFIFPDAGLTPFLDFIDGADRTLDAYVFVLSNRTIEARFVDAVKRGVTVRVIIEPNPSGRADEQKDVFDRLRSAGVQVKYAGRPFSKTHVKSLVADHQTAWVGSFNYVQDWNSTRDYATVTENAATVAQLESTFDDDWNGRAPTRNTFINPESHLIESPTNGRAAITALLQSATKSIVMEQETLDDNAIIRLLGEKAKAGVDVNILLDNEDANQSSANALRRAASQIQVKVVRRPAMHAKLIVIDGSQMLIGSHNLSKDSLDDRREVSILLTNPAWIQQALTAVDNDRQELKPKAGTANSARRVPAAATVPAGATARPAATTAPTPAPAAAPAASAAAAAAAAATGGRPAALAGAQGTDRTGGETVPFDASLLGGFAEPGWPEKLLHMVIAAVLAALVAYRPWRYLIPGAIRPPRETADTQVMIAVAGAIMVSIIGDSVARAFGLVGLGGLIRFRSLIRDTRDAALMFLMIAIGMAAGLGLLALAAIVAVFAVVALTIFDVTDKGHHSRVSIKVDEPRVALQAIRTNFPTARILEAPNTKVMGPGAGTVVVNLNGEAAGADAAQILDLLRQRGVTGVRSVVLEDD